MKKIIIIAAAACTLTACQKVINIDLNETAPQYVIEGALQEGTQTFTVRVTKTTSYFASATTTPKVTTATVTVTADNGIATVLTNMGEGVYAAANYTAQAAHTYTLKVTDGANTFTAASYMPAIVPIDSVTIIRASQSGIFVPPSPGGAADSTTRYLITCHFKDPAGSVNYFRGNIVPQPTEQGNNGYTLIADKNLDGAALSFVAAPKFRRGTPVTVELMAIDKSTYNYFNQLDEFIGRGQQSVSPANPDTNWSGGALGYFGAMSVQRKTVVTP
jgi:hypothetical protein